MIITDNVVALREMARVAGNIGNDVRGRRTFSQMLLDAADEIEEHRHYFELRRAADMRAITRWREATGRDLVMPDHADLVIWLLQKLEDTDIVPNKRGIIEP